MDTFDMVVASIVREGKKIVVCGKKQKDKLKVHPDYYKQIVTNPLQIKDKTKPIVFMGEMTDEERSIWRSYLA